MCGNEGELWLTDEEMSKDVSLWERAEFSVPGLNLPPPTPNTASCSDQWFCGKMSAEWFQKHVESVDHDDDRARRDWSKKESELKKGPNRFAPQWKEFMEGKMYQDPDCLP